MQVVLFGSSIVDSVSKNDNWLIVYKKKVNSFILSCVHPTRNCIVHQDQGRIKIVTKTQCGYGVLLLILRIGAHSDLFE